MFQVGAQLVHHHHGAVLLGLARAGAEVGQGHHARLAVQFGAGEVADIGAQVPGGQRFQHRGVADHAVAAEVEQHRARLHEADVGVVDQVARGIQQRHVQAHELRTAQHLVDAGGAPHLRRQAPGGVDRDLGVEAQHVHAQRNGGFGHQAADLAQAHDAQRLAGQLVAGKLLLALFHGPVEVGRCDVQIRHEAQRRCNLARRHQHAGNHHLLHRVGVGARRVEHRHAARTHRLDRNVVGARTRAADGTHAGRDGHRVQVGTAHQNGGGIGHVLAHAIAFGRQA